MKSHPFVIGGFVACLVPLVLAARPGAVNGAAQTPAPTQTPAVTEIVLEATKYKYTPNKVEVPLNSVVRFKITAKDNDHGFEIDGHKETSTKIPKGETKTVEYKADKAGTISFKCSSFCGMGHGGMKGQIVVK